MRIAFIGGGNMTTSLVGGLVRRGTVAGSLTVSDPVPAQVERLAREFGVQGVADNCEAVREADLVVLAVKPQQMAEVARGIAPQLTRRRRVVVSIAAGIRLEDLVRGWAPGFQSCARCPIGRR